MARHEVATRRVLYEIPGMRSVRVRQAEFPGVDGQPLPMEIYEAITPISDPPPAVVLVEGYPDPGFIKHVGCRFMEMEWTISMAQLIAASGMRAITHANRDAKADAVALMSHVAKVHGSRIGIWATSGHGPVAMHALGYAACGVFINPVVGESASGKPMFIVRSGKDETPGLNAALDRFVALALESNHPLWLVNHPEAPHSFDLHHDSDTTRHILGQGLAFLRLYLGRQEGQS